jgi:hypothetical protein
MTRSISAGVESKKDRDQHRKGSYVQKAQLKMKKSTSVSDQEQTRPLEPKIHAAFKSSLPFFEEYKRTLTEYRTQMNTIHTREMKG